MIVKTVVLLILVHYSLSVPVELQKRNTQQNQQPSNGCQLIQGPPGPPGPPGTFSLSYTEVKEFKNDIQLELEENIMKKVNQTLSYNEDLPNCHTELARTFAYPAESCRQIYDCNRFSPSGRYWIKTTDNDGHHIQQIFCEMEAQYNGIRGGWTRVAYINMTEDGAQCPTSLRTLSSPKKLCGKKSYNVASCSSVTFPTEGMRYSKICGQAVGYQYYSMDAFHGPKDINSYYVDGMSITYGSPRKHIWTYAVGLSDDHNYNGNYNCPCAKYPGPAPPSFVGDHYYCESGNTGGFENTLYINDPLWDGEGCGTGNNCCAQPGMPWFCRTLPQEVEGDIEVRLCANEGNEELYLELLEIYIQ